jgi:hypothetical protein
MGRGPSLLKMLSLLLLAVLSSSEFAAGLDAFSDAPTQARLERAASSLAAELADAEPEAGLFKDRLESVLMRTRAHAKTSVHLFEGLRAVKEAPETSFVTTLSLDLTERQAWHRAKVLFRQSEDGWSAEPLGWEPAVSQNSITDTTAAHQAGNLLVVVGRVDHATYQSAAAEVYRRSDGRWHLASRLQSEEIAADPVVMEVDRRGLPLRLRVVTREEPKHIGVPRVGPYLTSARVWELRGEEFVEKHAYRRPTAILALDDLVGALKAGDRDRVRELTASVDLTKRALENRHALPNLRAVGRSLDDATRFESHVDRIRARFRATASGYVLAEFESY